MATTVNSRVIHPTAAKWILRVALDVTFEDDPVPRKEGNEGAMGEGGAFVRRQWECGSDLDGWILG
jgi:hypothetical protein